MNPPWSMVFFTTLAGAAQGLALALFGLEAAQALGLADGLPQGLFIGGALLVLALGGVGLVAASFHLGHPLRAWRAVAMWRTSWLSREVIVLPLFLACVAGWGLAHAQGGRFVLGTLGWGALAAVLALVLYGCTAMIYAAIKAIPQWAHPLTVVNFSLLGMASGLGLATWLAAWLAPRATMAGGAGAAATLAGLALALTLLGALSRSAALWRNLRPLGPSSRQTALGLRHPRIVQTSQGAMGGMFQTREFFHAAAASTLTQVRLAAALLGFALPMLAWWLLIRPTAAEALPVLPAVAAALSQMLGLLAERWSFFTEGQHTQNHYHAPVARAAGGRG